MASKLVESPEIQRLLDRIAGLDTDGGVQRCKRITRRIVSDLFTTIDEYDVTPEEFFRALHFLQQGAAEFGLMAPGLGFDRFLDLRMDVADRARGNTGGTPRAIEGPLYVAGAPLEKAEARLDDGTDPGEVLIMQGKVLGASGKPLAGAVVDVWHANSRGAYSFFDRSQSAFNNRRRIETDRDGRYRFRSILPAGYGVPPQGATDTLMACMGRHGLRPAHIHFFVSAPGHRHLTTQINIPGDPHLHDDFAFATRDELIPEVVRRSRLDRDGKDVPQSYLEIAFDFVLLAAGTAEESQPLARPRAQSD